MQKEKMAKHDNIKNKSAHEVWLDVAKAIGVYFVFLGHMWYWTDYPLFNQMIYSIHIPMFFIISGYLIKRNPLEKNIWQFFKKKFFRMLLPAIILNLCLSPIYFAFANKIPSTGEIIKQLLFFEGKLLYNLACWYFFVLFEAYLIERILNIVEKKWWVKLLYLILFFALGFFLYKYKFFPYFGIDRAIVALGFLIVGMFLKDILKILKQTKNFKLYLFFIFVVSFVLWYLLSVCFNVKLSYYSMELGNYFHSILGGVFGSVWYFVLCAIIAQVSKISSKFAENTVFIVCSHYVLITLLKEFIVKPFKLLKTTELVFIEIGYAIIGCLVLWGISLLLSKFAPWLTGVKVKKKEINTTNKKPLNNTKEEIKKT